MQTIKNTFLFILLFFLLFFISSLKLLQIPEGPHGGQIKVAGNYHIEMKSAGSEFYAFLLDKSKQPVSNKIVTGNVRFFYSDDSIIDVKLLPFEEDGFYIPSVINGFLSCRVSFRIFGKSVSAEFENNSLLVKKKK